MLWLGLTMVVLLTVSLRTGLKIWQVTVWFSVKFTWLQTVYSPLSEPTVILVCTSHGSRVRFWMVHVTTGCGYPPWVEHVAFIFVLFTVTLGVGNRAESEQSKENKMLERCHNNVWWFPTKDRMSAVNNSHRWTWNGIKHIQYMVPMWLMLFHSRHYYELASPQQPPVLLTQPYLPHVR